MYLIEKLKDFLHPHTADVEYFCYDCYGMFHCNIPGYIVDWSRITIVCNRCNNNSTIIHKVNGIPKNAD